MKTRTEKQKHEMLDTVERGRKRERESYSLFNMEFIYSTNTFYRIGKELKKPCLAKIVKRKNKREKGLKTTCNMAGITLVALVVTIVILLILAGVTTNLILGEGGIINKAQEAVNRTNNAVKEEENRLNELLNILEQETGGEEEPEDKIVEPENIDDWEWRVETAETAIDPKYIGTITILRYKGNATEVVIPNQINGVLVKTVGEAGMSDPPYWTGYVPNIVDASIMTDSRKCEFRLWDICKQYYQKNCYLIWYRGDK